MDIEKEFEKAKRFADETIVKVGEFIKERREAADKAKFTPKVAAFTIGVVLQLFSEKLKEISK